MKMCGLDRSGRPTPEPVTDKTFVIDADVFIEAIGQSPNPLLIREISDLSIGARGNLIVNDHGQTSIGHLFAGGDVATGAATP